MTFTLEDKLLQGPAKALVQTVQLLLVSVFLTAHSTTITKTKNVFHVTLHVNKAVLEELTADSVMTLYVNPAKASMHLTVFLVSKTLLSLTQVSVNAPKAISTTKLTIFAGLASNCAKLAAKGKTETV